MESIEKSTAISSQIRQILNSSTSKYLIYAERLKNLSLEKTYFFIDEIRKEKEKYDITRQLLTKKFEINTSRVKIFHVNHKSHKIDSRQLSVENIDVINLQNESKVTFRSRISSPLDDEENSKSCYFSNNDFIEPEIKRKSFRAVSNDLKKHFYSKCLIAKLNFSSRHPAQYIQIHELYRKSIETGVPVENWEEFIREEFKHPQRWVNLNVIPK